MKTAKIIRVVSAFLALLCFPIGAMAQNQPVIGVVIEAGGGAAQISNPGLNRDVRAAAGLKLFQGDTISTGPGSTLKIKLNDGSLVLVGEESILKLKQFAFDREEKTRTSRLDLLMGKAKAMVNDLADFKERRFQIKTPTAVAGVRSTKLLVLVEDWGNMGPVLIRAVNSAFRGEVIRPRAHPLATEAGARLTAKYDLNKIVADAFVAAGNRGTPPDELAAALAHNLMKAGSGSGGYGDDLGGRICCAVVHSLAGLGLSTADRARAVSQTAMGIRAAADEQGLDEERLQNQLSGSLNPCLDRLRMITLVAGFDHPVDVYNPDKPRVKVTVRDNLLTLIRFGQFPTAPRRATRLDMKRFQGMFSDTGGGAETYTPPAPPPSGNAKPGRGHISPYEFQQRFDTISTNS